MTQEYESVLNAADRVNLIRDHTDIDDLALRTEQAVLAKLQPQLDAIGAGGVSGQQLRQPRVPEGYKLVPIEPTNKQVCLIACEIIGYDETGTCRTDTPLWPEYVRKAESAYKAMLAASPEPSNE